MKCNCSIANAIMSAVIVIVALWPNLIGAVASRWIIVIVAALMFIHSLMHKHTYVAGKSK